MAIDLFNAYYEARCLLYVMSPSVIVNFRVIINTYSGDTRFISIVVRTNNSLILRAIFFSSGCRDGYSTHKFGKIKFSSYQGGVVDSLPT